MFFHIQECFFFKYEFYERKFPNLIFDFFLKSSSSDASEESNEDKPTPDEPLQKTEAEKPEVDCDSDSGK